MCGMHVIMCVLLCHCVVSVLFCTCVQVDAWVCDHVHEPCARVDAHVQGMCAFAWWLCVVILCLLIILTGWERVLCVSVHEESLVRIEAMCTLVSEWCVPLPQCTTWSGCVHVGMTAAENGPPCPRWGLPPLLQTC